MPQVLQMELLEEYSLEDGAYRPLCELSAGAVFQPQIFPGLNLALAAIFRATLPEEH